MKIVDYKQIKQEDLVHLARLASAGKTRDVQIFIRRLSNRYRLSMPELAKQLGSLAREAPGLPSVLRGSVVQDIPVDLDSRLQLARPQYPVELDAEPIWSAPVRDRLDEIVFEQSKRIELHRAGLHPTKSALFTGPPGVGKTLAAKWLAQRLDRPLVVLDLAAVMSSFLGRTGNNVRNVIDYAKGVNCVFLLDEFDAIAKRRDDAVEVGELKRLVTVLLQEIDGWPESGLLLAATNHHELLDPAVWRRFESIIDFPMPTTAQVELILKAEFGSNGLAPRWRGMLVHALNGLSFAEIGRELMRVKRQSVLNGGSLVVQFRQLIQNRIQGLNREERTAFALLLMESGLSQRETHAWTGISRDTIRKAQQK